jgi:hypothetical protein
VAEYLLELYVSRTDGDAIERAAGRARTVSEELTREGTPVRYLRSIFVPEDETCFLLFGAPSMDAVKEVARRAALQFERISAAAPSEGHRTRSSQPSARHVRRDSS